MRKTSEERCLICALIFFSLSDCGRNESRLCGSKCDVGRGKLRYISTWRKFGSNLINCLCMSFNLQ
jgi:hypothetical protein